jgi:hypothetical protein
VRCVKLPLSRSDGKALHDVFTRAKQARDQFGEMYAASPAEKTYLMERKSL